MADTPALPAGADVPANDGPPIDQQVDPRIAAVQAQANREVGSAEDLARGEQIATASHYGSLAVGAGLAAQGGPVGLAVFAAGVGGGMAGAWISEAIGAPDFVADGLEAIGMHRIGGGGPHPARKGHQVAHSYAFAGFLAAIVVGVAVAALVVATGGLAAPVLIGAALAGGLAGGFVGSALGGALAQMGSRTGPIMTGSPDVTIESLPAARMTDTAACGKESSPQPIIEGSETIFVNGLPMARVGHKLLCGAVVDEGAASVFMDQTTVACAQPAPDIPVWARVAADWLGFLPLGRIAGNLGRTRSNTSKGVPNNCRTTCIDPVDVASGEFVEWRTDIDVPGVLPLRLNRHYASRREGSAVTSLFGPRWTDSWSVSLTWSDAGPARGDALPNIDYHDDEGVTLTFETPGDTLDAEHLRAPGLHLTGEREAPILLDRTTGRRMHFAWVGEAGMRARLVAISDASGNRCDFIHDDKTARLVRLQHSDGWHAELHWSATALQSVWLQEPDRHAVELVRYAHDHLGRVVRSASESSGRLGYRYDSQHHITGWHDDGATDVSVVYDDTGRVAEIVTPGGLHSGRFRYDLEGRFTQVVESDPSQPHQAPHTSVYFYNEHGLVTRMLDPLGRSTLTDWDLHLRVTCRTDALGRRTLFECDDKGLLMRRVDLAGDALERVSLFAYDVDGRLVAATDPHGRTLRRSFDAAALLVDETSADGRKTAYEYDARGRLRRERIFGLAQAEGELETGTVEHHFDEQHRPCGRTAPNGGHSAWRQDRLGRVDWFTDPVGATTRYDYDDAAHDPLDPPRAEGHTSPTCVVAADGTVVRQRFNCEGLLIERTDAAGATRRWQWGPFDLLLGQTDALGQTTAFSYALDGRVAEIANAAGQRWRWRHDAAGRPVEQHDFAGRCTTWTHDAADRPLTRRAPDGVILRYEWDAADRVCAIHAPDARLSYLYDEHDRLVQAQVWQTGVPARLGTACDESLQSDLRLAYDGEGRLIEEVHVMGAEALPRRLAYRYDDEGRLVGREGPFGLVRYEHDALGLLRELHTTYGAVHIERDAMGREITRSSVPPHARGRAGLQGSSHFRLQQQHDKLGRLVQQRSGAAAPSAHALPAPVQRRYHWQQDRLTGVDDARFGSVRWQLDAREQVTEAQYHPAHLGQIDDGPGRSSAALAQHPAVDSRPLRQESFRYDVLGNLSAQGTNAEAMHALRYAGDTVVENGESGYVWDACGRMTSRTEVRRGFRPRTWRYEWDAFDRLKAVETPEGERWHYVYDALGRRRAKRCVNAPNPNPLRSGSDARARRKLLQAEYQWDGPTLAVQWKTYADGSSAAPVGQRQTQDVQEWHHEPGTFVPLVLLQQRESAEGLHTQLMHVVTDVSGAPRELLASDGELLWAAQLNTWGTLGACHVKDADRSWAASFASGSRHAANDPSVDIDLRYTNQWEDTESGLFYNLNRYYDPGTGQYASQDPLGPTGGLRTHGYVHNPLTWGDPFGLAACPASRLVGNDKSGRPLTSPHYSVWDVVTLPRQQHGLGRPDHFKYANEALYNKIQANPSFGRSLPPDVVAHVQPGARGAFSDRSPPGMSWHHNARNPTLIELIPRAQHRAPGPVQGSLHPNQEGGFKHLQDGLD